MSETAANQSSYMSGFLLGDWQVQPLSGFLERAGQQVHLEPKVMDVLVCLARHQGQVVSRDMLLAEVWGKTIVSDDAITRCISELRSALGDTGRNRSIIRTIPRRGYILLMPVTLLVDDKDADDANSAEQSSENKLSDPPPATSTSISWRHYLSAGRIGAVALTTVVLLILISSYFENASDGLNNTSAGIGVADVNIASSTSELPDLGAADEASTPNPIRSLAILPFANLSGEPEHDYFSDGLSEDIRNAFLNSTNIRIAARTSTSVFKDKAMDVREIARQLNVDALIEGTVRIIDDRLRITLQLTSGTTGFAVWSTSDERNLEDKIVLQGEIAEEIVRQLAPSLVIGSNPFATNTSHVQAHDFYLLGRHHWHRRTEESLLLAETYFQQALNLDPDYALAYAGLADALLFQTSYGSLTLQESEDQIREIITRSLELNPNLPEAHASLGILLEDTGNMEDALESYRRAIELKPQYSMAQMWLGAALLKSFDVKTAHSHFATALEVDPLHNMVQYNYVHSLQTLGKYEQALASIDRFYQTNPSEDLLEIRLGLYLELGNYEQVLALAVGHSFTGGYKPYTSEFVVNALIELRRYEEARQILSENIDQIDGLHYFLSQVNLALAERDANGVELIASGLDTAKLNADHKMSSECGVKLQSYLLGVAAYIDSNYAAADALFGKLRQLGFDRSCLLSQPGFNLSLTLYHASSRFHLQSDDSIGRELTSFARQQLDEIRALGWNTPEISSLELVLLVLTGQEQQLIARLDQSEHHLGEVLGHMQISPLFDELLNSEIFNKHGDHFLLSYQHMQEKSMAIDLAKLGL